MAIGRLQAALAAATNEVTVAAANINFDFTLIKCEAPKEFQGLGNVLAKKRKENAEYGSIHVLARQLGALFDGVCHPTPALLEAYGNRASAIAKASQKTSEPYIGTPFGEYTGADGTSIWAAATSSKCALHVHLLACILARMWTASEAVAIWTELVSERKKEIARKVDEGEPVAFALAAAVGQDISRPQLVAWDTSARAWLSTADQFSCNKQKQLELILKNLDLAVTDGPAVFPSVTNTWKIALATMEKLVWGMPQAVNDGAALIGLSAWHLYPDMVLYSPKFVEVKMEDSNVAEGGVLSLGVSRGPDLSDRKRGVRWSLSLAQLRHYGRPVQVTAGLKADSRLTWPQLTLVTFAAILEQWDLDTTLHEPLAQLLTSLFQHAKPGWKNDKQMMRRFKILSDGASSYLNRNTGDQDLNHRLIQLGRRRSRNFLGTRDSKRERFNFSSPNTLMLVLKDTESAILYLRHAANRLTNERTHPHTFLIRHNINLEPDVSESVTSYSELSDGASSDCPSDSEVRNPTSSRPDTPQSAAGSFFRIFEALNEPDIPKIRSPSALQNESYVMMTAVTPKHEGETGDAVHHRWLPAGVPNILVPNDETYTLDALDRFKCSGDAGHAKISVAEDSETKNYHPILGFPETTALFARDFPTKDLFNSITILEDCQWCLDHDLIEARNLVQVLEHFLYLPATEIRGTLDALSTAAWIYEDIPDATINTNIFLCALIRTDWARSSKSKRPRSEVALSIIAFFETGGYNVHPNLLHNAIAVAYADSIFVPSAVSHFSCASRSHAKSLVDPRPIRISQDTSIYALSSDSRKHRQTRTYLSSASTGTNDARN
ncbi:hypothetical protein ACJQWK_10262 [Exserohilum turcicum]